MKINVNDLTKNSYTSLKECFTADRVPLNINDVRGKSFIIKKDDKKAEKMAKLSLKELLA